MLFSIITVSYNSEKTIERTIKSVFSQTFGDYEYLIVDGASKDKTLDIIKRFEPMFSGKMKWVSEPDSGIYNAMNKGIRMAKGEIVAIVNSDDWLSLDALEIVNHEIEKDPNNKKRILTGEILFHYSDGGTQLYPTSYERYEYYAKKYRMGINHPATFVPKYIYDKIGLFDENYKLFADADFVVRCYESNIGMCFINKVLSNMSDDGASSKPSITILKESLYKIKKHAKSRRELFNLYLETFVGTFARIIIPYSLVKRIRRKINAGWK